MFIPIAIAVVSGAALYFLSQKFFGGKKLFNLDRQKYTKFKLIEKVCLYAIMNHYNDYIS